MISYCNAEESKEPNRRRTVTVRRQAVSAEKMAFDDADVPPAKEVPKDAEQNTALLAALLDLLAARPPWRLIHRKIHIQVRVSEYASLL